MVVFLIQVLQTPFGELATASLQKLFGELRDPSLASITRNLVRR
jgi:hypothetical protein